MAIKQSVYTLPSSDKLKNSSSTMLKNKFKEVFSQLESGVAALAITRNSKKDGVLISAELYDAMVSELSRLDPLNALREEYDRRFENAQSDEATSAYDVAFNSTPEQLGKHALEKARSL